MPLPCFEVQNGLEESSGLLEAGVSLDRKIRSYIEAYRQTNPDRADPLDTRSYHHQERIERM